MGALLALDRVSKTYGEGGGMVRALDGVDLAIKPANSSRSWGLRVRQVHRHEILGCLDSPTQGKFLFNNVDVDQVDTRRPSIAAAKFPWASYFRDTIC